MNEPFKILVVYYSFEGNTKLIAESLAGAVGADVMQLIPKKEHASKGFSKYLWGGSQVMMKRKPELMPLVHDPARYDLVMIGTPVWAWTLSPPVASFLNAVDLKDKQIGLFCCHGGNAGKTIAHMKNLIPNSRVIGEIEFFEPIKTGKAKAASLAEAWAKKLVSQLSYD